jgi:hypothetical protein
LASKSPNTRFKVPTNQESNSLAPRNRVQKLKIADFYRFTGDLLKNTSHRFLMTCPTDLSAKSADYRPNPADLVRRPTRRCARPIYRQKRPITGRVRLISSSSPPIRFAACPVFAPSRFIGKIGRFSPRRRRIALSRTAFGSSLNRTEWGTMNTLFSRVGETEYHIHE